MLRPVAAFALLVVPLTARAADDDNPFKNAKVGDYAVYTLATKIGAKSGDGTVTQTVTAKTDKEATVKMVVAFKAGDKESKLPDMEIKVDLTRPYDPTQGAVLLPGAEVKSDRQKDGKEKLTVGGKEHDAAWTTYKMKAKNAGTELTGEAKVWTAPNVPLGVLKTVITADAGGQKVEITTELKETGTAKK